MQDLTLKAGLLRYGQALLNVVPLTLGPP